MPDRIFRRSKPSGPGQDPYPDDPFAVADAARLPRRRPRSRAEPRSRPNGDGYPTAVYALGRVADRAAGQSLRSGPRSARAPR